MSADQQDLIDHLMMQAAMQQTGPSLYGLQAQADPNNIQALLGKLKQQQVLDQSNAPTPGPYGYLHDAGRGAFNSIGSSLGGQLAAFGNGPQQGPSPQIQAQRDAIMAGNQSVQQDLANGVDPQQAKINALQKAVSMGYSAAGPELQKAVEEKQKTDTAKATEFMDTQKGNAAADEIPNRAIQNDRNLKKDTWTTIGQGNGYIVQKNGLGEISTKKNQDAASSAAASVTPDGMKSMLDYYHTNGSLPPGVTRSPAMASMFWQAEGQYQTTTGNNAAAATANKMELHSLNADTAKTQTAMGATSAYLTTMDKNIEKARTLGNQLDFSDVTGFNKALQAWDRGTSDPQYAKYNVFFNSVATEYAKLSSGNMGNTTVSDSQRHETQQVINSGVGNGGMNGIFDALKEEGANKVSGYQEHLEQNMQRIRGFGSNERAGLPQTAPRGAPQGAASTPQPSANPAQNAQGWTLHTDKFGKQAYVSPDGKQFQMVGTR